MSERGSEFPIQGNPFVPDDFGAVTPQRRRAYAQNVLGVREKLQSLVRSSTDGVDLRALIGEVDAALGVVRGENDPDEDCSRDDGPRSGARRGST